MYVSYDVDMLRMIWNKNGLVGWTLAWDYNTWNGK